jgi:hypothetical protein
VDYETIKANMENEQIQNNVNNDNIGAMILRNFNQGRIGNNAEPATNSPASAGATPRGG